MESVRHTLRLRRLLVTEVTRPTPRLVRVSLGGEELAGFRSDGPADHVKAFFPAAGEREPVVPTLGPSGIEPDAGLRPIGRDYTPRHHRLHEGVLELDFVLHDGGHAAAWADRAEVGDPLAIGGPRGSQVPVGRFEHLVLIGDESALPAVHNWLRWAAADVAVTIVVEVQDGDDVQPLASAADFDVHWVERGVARPGRSTLLVDAVAALAAQPPGTFWWVAGETATVAAVRRHLVEVAGAAEDLVHSRGYWKLGTSDHQEPHTD